MTSNPLARPADPALLSRFAKHFGIVVEPHSVESLKAVTRAFAALPYENLSKIIRFAETGDADRARETPEQILKGHLAVGTGGTCFSLTATLLHLVRSLGFEAEPLLADRHYGVNTHCALQVTVEGRRHLIDPGFLLVDPVPIDLKAESNVPTAFHSIVLTPSATPGQLVLATQEGDRRKVRLTLKTDPVDAGQFLKAWDESFTWDMMQYPVLTRVIGNRQVYQRGLYQQIRSGSLVTKSEADPDQLVDQIAAQFGIAPNVVEQALRIIGEGIKSSSGKR